MKLGNHNLPRGLFLGPMAGYTDYAMRTVCRFFGAEWLTSEMVSAKAVCFGDRKTAPLARVLPSEMPCSVQLFGHEPEILAEAAETVSRGMGGGVIPAAIDLNMGCPVHKVVANGDGSALMRDPALCEKLVRAVRDAVSLPVTVKIRAGWDENSVNATEVARAAEAGGADAVIVHGRTRRQFYSGTADYRVITDVKKAVSVPVIGNGDVRDAESALRLFRETGCDGIMIGRAAVGNPFLFREISSALTGKECPPPTGREKYETALWQLSLASEDKGEEIAILECRKHIGEYLAGYRGGGAARAAIHAATSRAEIASILAKILLGESDRM